MLYRDLKNSHLIYQYSTSAADVYSCRHGWDFHGVSDGTLLYYYYEVRIPTKDEFYVVGYDQGGFNYVDNDNPRTNEVHILHTHIQDSREAAVVETKYDTESYLQDYINGVI